MSDTAHYRLIVTLCGADSCRGLLMRQHRIESGHFPLEPQEVTMNHIINRDRETWGFSPGFSAALGAPTSARLFAGSREMRRLQAALAEAQRRALDAPHDRIELGDHALDTDDAA
jgi:hypothetical protein